MAKEKLALAKYIKAAQEAHLTLGEYLLPFSATQMDLSVEELKARLRSMLSVMAKSVASGLTGVRSRSGLSGGDAVLLKEAMQQGGKTLLGEIATQAVINAIAVNECNAAMGRIVAAPTAGAAGVLPGVLLALRKHYELDEDTLVRALVVAGQIGLVISSRAYLAGAVGGCQAEIGSAAAMAAGAAVEALGGAPCVVGQAVALTLKNMLGLVCDPVAGLVEVPCVKRNAAGAVQALLGAQLALAGVSSFIPADEVIDAMERVGASLPCSLRETALGGLAATPTAVAWAKEYFEG